MTVTDKEGTFVLSDQDDAALAAFESELANAYMMGEWQIKRKAEPDPGGVPYLWTWQTAYDKMVKATKVLDLDRGARRSLLFLNPGLPNQGTILSMRIGLQMMNAGELAWAHRHTMAAIRFVLKGSPNTYTVVDGEKLYMEDWALILTPPGCWHHHENHSDDVVIWLDAIDTPFVKNLNTLFYRQHELPQPPLADPKDVASHRVGLVRPSWEAPKGGLPVVYRWADTERVLNGLAEAPGSPYDGVLLKYVEPVTGGPVMPTFSCNMQMLRPGEATKRHRHTFSAVYHVLRGSGATDVGDTTLNWEKGDTFVVPNWAWHRHRNLRGGEDALLFVIDDSPIVDAFRLNREQVED